MSFLSCLEVKVLHVFLVRCAHNLLVVLIELLLVLKPLELHRGVYELSTSQSIPQPPSRLLLLPTDRGAFEAQQPERCGSVFAESCSGWQKLVSLVVGLVGGEAE